jgi:hypothetical protein
MSPGPEDEVSQAEKRRIIEDEAANTMHGRAQAEANIEQGRFTQVTAATVIGSKSGVASAYPAASSAHQTQLPDEPPTGYAIDEMAPLDPVPEQGVKTSEARDHGGAPSSHSPGVVAPPPSTPDDGGFDDAA